jgi:predicted dithiol-disulfide oxidoreductase (DUF899 family)
MSSHVMTTRQDAEGARHKLREREEELSRLSGEIAQQRRELPWVKVGKVYTFATDAGPKTLVELFEGALAAARLPYDVRAQLDC